MWVLHLELQLPKTVILEIMNQNTAPHVGHSVNKAEPFEVLLLPSNSQIWVAAFSRGSPHAQGPPLKSHGKQIWRGRGLLIQPRAA